MIRDADDHALAAVLRHELGVLVLGGTGVKVKPDSYHKDVPRERTIAQIGGALRELAPFAQDLGQELRLEVHGSCADPRTIAAIVAHAVNNIDGAVRYPSCATALRKTKRITIACIVMRVL